MDGHRRIFLLNRSVVPKFGQSTHLNKNRTVFFSGGARAQFEKPKTAGSGKVKNH
jgi:hypothetical protein